MSAKITESDVELAVIDLLEKQGYTYQHACEPDIESEDAERASFKEVLLKNRIRRAINELNPTIPQSARDQAIKDVLNVSNPSLISTNESFHEMLIEGVNAQYLSDSGMRGTRVQLIDFDNPSQNEFLVVNQFTVEEDGKHKRPDVILFINGIPLVVIELKNPTDTNATVKKAFRQLSNYKNAIPALFHYNSLLIASDGFDARCGTISSGIDRFMAWKSVDGIQESSDTTPQIQTMVNGMLRPEVLLDLIRHFIVFERTRREDQETGQIVVETIKKVAAYHQYFAVKKAVDSTKAAASGDGDRKGGVIWHTQGSGKSLSMVFYTGKLVQSLDNPTVVVITDRNDLDDQLFDTFANCKQLLRQDPVQAGNRAQIRELLQRASGGVIFTTIHKFAPEEGLDECPCLSDRRNIVVLADEAHRSQYGFEAKTRDEKDEAGNVVGVRTVYGFAKHLRDALPNATYLGFTGTPIEFEDKSTPAVFGDYIDIYDISQAEEDEATVKIYYESRLAKVRIKEGYKDLIDEEVAAITEDEDSLATQKAKAKWARVEAIIGHSERLESVAKDFVSHFEERQQVLDGKVMIVTMSRRIAVELYDQIKALRPDWHDGDLNKGQIKVVMTSSSSDPASWQQHNTTKQQRKDLALRVKDPADPLKIVIVRDMWLTGFDAPCLHTLYVDKPMKGHNLMQAIARVNRIYPGKKAGLVVDYIGIASELKIAAETYTRSKGRGQPTLPLDEALLVMQEKLEIVRQMFHSFNYEPYFSAKTIQKLSILLEAQEHILGLTDGKDRFIRHVVELSKVHAICIPHLKAMDIKDEIAFFQAVKARLQKFEPKGSGKSDEEIETAIRHIVDKALVSEGVTDIFGAAGIKKPDVSILSDEFLEEVQGMKHKNLALELLKKLLNDEIKIQKEKNIVQGRKLSEMLETALKKYQNNLLTATEIIKEIVEIAKEVREAQKRGEQMNLSNDELAFYDALCVNDSAVMKMGDELLKGLARLLVEKVRKNASIDWNVKASVRAKLKVMIKKTLRKVGYPPDQQKLAIELVMEQAEQRASEWAV
jgi:type I restriction enzyme, R subunit